MSCPICSNIGATVNPTTNDARIIDCPQCGSFKISGRAIAVLNVQDNFAAERWKISSWVNESKPAIVGTVEIDTALQSAVPSLHHRADRMLRFIVSKYPSGTTFYDGEVFTSLMSIGWNANSTETRFMIGSVLCNEMGLLTHTDNRYYRVSPKGFLYLEGRREAVSSVGFCAMWFSEEVQPLWKEVIEPAITAAGYEALRIDSKQHNGKIDDEIMASIRASKFVVSDFTGSRGGVYYEAGFAHGLGLPVIFMCRENDLKDIHFDVRQYNCILWTPEKLEEAQSQLKNRILATLGQGPKLVQ